MFDPHPWLDLAKLDYPAGFPVYRDLMMSMDILLSDGFFDGAYEVLDVGDFLHISGSDGGAIRYVAYSSHMGVKLVPLR